MMLGINIREHKVILALIPLSKRFIIMIEILALVLPFVERKLNAVDKMTSAISMNPMAGFHINKRHTLIISGIMIAFDMNHILLGLKIIVVEICKAIRRSEAKAKILTAILFVSNVQDLTSIFEDATVEKVKATICKRECRSCMCALLLQRLRRSPRESML